MIYSCPHCSVKLALQPAHLEQEIKCPECGEAFTPEKIPPVEVYRPEQHPVSFFRVFLVVVYAAISVLILGLFCFGIYLGAKSLFPEYFKEQAQIKERAVQRKIQESYIERTNRLNDSAPAAAPAVQPADVSEDQSIRDKNKEAEEAFLKNLNNSQKKTNK